MALLIKHFNKEGINFSLHKVGKSDCLIKDKSGDHTSGYLISATDEKGHAIRILSLAKFTHKPTRRQVNKFIDKAKESRLKMDSSGGIESTLNLLQEMNFKPSGEGEYL